MSSDFRATLVQDFSSILRVPFALDEHNDAELKRLLDKLSRTRAVPAAQRRANLLAQVRRKFRLNADAIACFLAEAVKHGTLFNYHEKLELNAAFDLADLNRLKKLLRSRQPASPVVADLTPLLELFTPMHDEETIDVLHRELRSPTLTRKDSKPRDWSDQILLSLFGAYVFEAFPAEEVHRAVDAYSRENGYEANFWLSLHKSKNTLFKRTNALSIINVIPPTCVSSDSYATVLGSVLSALKGVYIELANHGYVAVILPALHVGDKNHQWEAAGDITLFAEKHIATQCKQQFFQWRQIQEATVSYINGLDLDHAAFYLWQTGFYYSDCFVIGEGPAEKLLLLFQKHDADETLIPCPACRSHDVQGNSYPSLGVRSWECRNQFCPDRSRFNRGKRYSFLQLLKQQAIEDPANAVPVQSVRAWARDVQPFRPDNELLEMLVRHYTLAGDTVKIFDWLDQPVALLGRHLKHAKLGVSEFPGELRKAFFGSPYFHRYIIARTGRPDGRHITTHKVGLTDIYLGDAYEVLQRFASESIDAAVTSPPYYNAREYSQWSNIYNYLYDMYNICCEIYRTLKPGGIYLYNIFDYFDNERNVALSAMGEKRMILSAYTIDVFRRAGFGCEGNIVWDKGDIEGKRGFNNGNFSPYYQAPFNCWEHILIFAKPGAAVKLSGAQFPTHLRQKPVHKMVRGGENVHGHTAPFPIALPDLLVQRMRPGQTVLDPFAGSMSTGCAAQRRGVHAVCIEVDNDYYQLGLKKLRQDTDQYAFL